MSDGIKRRRYDATGRRQRARRTRLEVLDAARRLFVDRGYAATKMTDVAAEAGVSVELIYGAFRSKANLLKTVFDVTIAGDDEPVALMERPGLLAVRNEPDPARALRRYAAFVAEIAPRIAPVHLVVLTAASSDPTVAELAEGLAAQRLTGMTLFARQLLDSGRLKVSQEDARDILWALNSAQTYDLLVVQRGWSLQRFEAFLGDAWIDLLLTPHAEA